MKIIKKTIEEVRSVWHICKWTVITNVDEALVVAVESNVDQVLVTLHNDNNIDPVSFHH